MADHIILHLQSVRSFLSQLPASKRKPVIDAQKLHLMGLLSTSTLSVADGSRVLAELRLLDWGDDTADALAEEVARRTNMECQKSGAQVRSKLQNYEALPNYLNQGQWAMLTSDRVNSSVKMEALIGHAAMLQLRHPSESSLQVLAAVFLASTDGLDKASALPPGVKYQTLQHIKKMVRSWAAKTHYQAVISELPSDPASFKQMHPGVWADVFSQGAPVPCAFDESRLKAVQLSIPMRSSSKMMASTSDGAGADKGLSYLVGLLQRFASQSGQGVCPIQYMQAQPQALAEEAGQLLQPLRIQRASPVPRLLPPAPAPAPALAPTMAEEASSAEEEAPALAAPPVLPAAGGQKRKLSVEDTTALILGSLLERKKGGKASKREGATSASKNDMRGPASKGIKQGSDGSKEASSGKKNPAARAARRARASRSRARSGNG